VAVSRLKLANTQPLVTLQHHVYQEAFQHARRLRLCANGHEWHINAERLVCPDCRQPGSRTYRRFLLRAGRRGGKTRIGALAAIEEAALPNTVGWCCAPSFPELEDYVMPAFFKQIPQAWLDHPQTDWSESERTLFLPNRSIVQFRSLDDPERGRGQGLHWLWIDEICKLTLKHWETIRPSLSEHRGAFIGTTTPKGEDWVHETFYEPAEAGKKGMWACVYRTLDNPIFQTDDGREEIAEAQASMTPEMFRQEYEADIVTFTGAVYGNQIDFAVIDGSDEQMQVYIPEWPKVNQDRPSVSALDPGTDHPFAGIHLVQTPKGLVAVGEYLERNKPYVIHANGIQAMRRDSTSRIGIDRSQAQAQIELAQYGLFTVPADNDVMAGINRVSSWLLANRTEEGTGALPVGGLILPKALVPRLIRQLRAYRWAESKEGTAGLSREQVYKKNDDLADALRYALMLYPRLPKGHPQAGEESKRDLSALPDDVRLQIERERRSVSTEEQKNRHPDDGAEVVNELGGDEAAMGMFLD
jgi:hypothetical protein